MPRKKKTKSSTSATVPTSPLSSTGTVNKSAFVRGLPASMSAVDVIAKAKAQGFTVSRAQVYTIRTNARARARKGGQRRPGQPTAGQPAVRNPRSLEAQFADLAIDLGFSKAQQLLQSLRQAAQGLGNA